MTDPAPTSSTDLLLVQIRDELRALRASMTEGDAAELREPAHRCVCGYVAKSAAGLAAHKRTKGH